jgi:hypothetical protein
MSLHVIETAQRIRSTKRGGIGRESFYLSAGGGLSPKPPSPSEPGCYTYALRIQHLLCMATSAFAVTVLAARIPGYARNLGSGEPMADGVTFAVAHQEIFHDPHHPSRILLPIGNGNDSPPRPDPGNAAIGLRVLAQDIGPNRLTTANKGTGG